MGYTHGTKWNKQLIKERIIDVINILNLNRFPSRSEIKKVLGNDSLHNAICRNGGYRYWAKETELAIKNSETKLGQDYEEVVMNVLKLLGFDAKRMSTKYPYDLLINSKVKVDVKVGRAYLLRGSRVHTFGISKRYATCDLYVVIALDEQDKIERTFIIPSHELQVVTLSIGKVTKYEKFLNRWDLIEKYSSFYAQIN